VVVRQNEASGNLGCCTAWSGQLHTDASDDESSVAPWLLTGDTAARRVEVYDGGSGHIPPWPAPVLVERLTTGFIASDQATRFGALGSGGQFGGWSAQQRKPCW
jgi:hypothetical protein